MARRARASRLETAETRRKLPVAKKPVFEARIARGITLGYRRNQGAGTWVVWVADGKGSNWTAAIGTADDKSPANGSDVLSFWEAQDLARDRARLGPDGTGDDGRPATIAKALERYAADLKLRGGDPSNAARVLVHLPETLARRSIAFVTSAELRQWRDQLAGKLAKASVNRTCAALRAALNLASDHDERIVSRRAWQTGLAAIRDAGQS